MNIKKEDVSKALSDLGLAKASENDLDQPEGSDFDGKNTNMKGKKKLSDEAPSPSDSATKSEVENALDVLKAAGYEVEDEFDGDDNDGGEMNKGENFVDGLPDEVKTKIDVSDFLRSLVDATGDAIDDMNDRIAKSSDAQGEVFDELVTQVGEIQKSQGKIGLVLKAICERIGVIENAPASNQKADLNKSQGAAPVSREFAQTETQPTAPAEGEGQQFFKSLSTDPRVAKSQITEGLCELVRKGDATDMDVISFESSGHVSMEMATKLQAAGL